MTTTWMSWSSGKDSAYALKIIQQSNRYNVKALLTTINEDYERVAMHSTRLELLQLQSESLGIPLKLVKIPKNCTNDIYQEKISNALISAEDEGIDIISYGDLYLEDVVSYRKNLHQVTKTKYFFPLWKRSTFDLARSIIDEGFEAYITCIDPHKLPSSFVGRKYDHTFLKDLPPNIDPCGENGEFHSFVYNGPNFSFPISCFVGETVEREGFIFADIQKK